MSQLGARSISAGGSGCGLNPRASRSETAVPCGGGSGCGLKKR